MLQYEIHGMDCASCVAKIETALTRLPGVSTVRVNLTTEKLQLTLIQGASIQTDDIENTIKRLGFKVAAIDHLQSAKQGSPSEQLAANHWWQTLKGKQLLVLGLLFVSAYCLSLLFSQFNAQVDDHNGAQGEVWFINIAVLIGVYPFAKRAIMLARTGSIFSIEMLMSIAAIGALVIGEAKEAAAVVFLYALGELLESIASNRARAGIRSLASLLPKQAILLEAEGKQHLVSASSLKVNDTVLVRIGDKIPADGRIITGTSDLDESPITGESMPVAKRVGDNVFAGSINLSATLQVQVEKTAADNTIARIIELVEQAHAAKSPTDRFIQRFSRYYTPTVMMMATLVMIIPPMIGQGDWLTWLYRGLALLLIACPCALVLSTPAAIASGLAVATRSGVLIKGGNALETIGRVRTIAFDKTGTLTLGTPRVTDVIAFSTTDSPTYSQEGLLSRLASVESQSAHPLAKAIVDYAQATDVDIPTASEFHTNIGQAERATVFGEKLAIASPEYASTIVRLTTKQQTLIKCLQQEGKTVSILCNEQSNVALGLVALRDELRADARQALSKLKLMGINCVMLTGDNRLTAQALAKQLNIEWAAQLLPQDKLQILNTLKAKGQVAMIGDGINDAPVLAAADVGIAMGGGTDVAIETADIAILNNQVVDVAHLVALSRATMRNIYQNVLFALGLKSLFLITTIFGLTGLWLAVLVDTGATILVTLNALRLLRFNTKDH